MDPVNERSTDYAALLSSLGTIVSELGMEFDTSDELAPPDRAFGLLTVIAAVATRDRLAIADDVGFDAAQQRDLILHVFDVVDGRSGFRLNAALDMLTLVITLCAAQADATGDAAHEALYAVTGASAALLTSILFGEGVVQALGGEPISVPPAAVLIAESRDLLRSALARLDELGGD